jgi:peptidyl-prolyl cis-trans isomerase B (cyclophilin B)
MTRLLVAALGAVLLLAACGGGSNKPATTAASTTTVSAGGGCPPVSQPKPRHESGQAPTGTLDAAKHWTATVETSCGNFTFTLDVHDSPHTTASFAALARSGFYDDTIFHRIVPGFVIQGGDPTATGAGGPGYTVVDTPPASAQYTLGTVAMAKTATQRAGTSGSQFFVVTGRNIGLPPDYALLGRVASGLGVVKKIGKLGDPADPNGTPSQIVVIDSITVSGS